MDDQEDEDAANVNTSREVADTLFANDFQYHDNQDVDAPAHVIDVPCCDVQVGSDNETKQMNGVL